MRAPTPTAAAEMATPVLADLKALVGDFERRMTRCTQHAMETRRTRLAATARGLPRPNEILAVASQRFDMAAGRLGAALTRNATAHERDLARVTGRFSPGLLERPARVKAERLGELGLRMTAAVERGRLAAAERLARLDQLRRSLDPDRPLSRGFARVHRGDGALVRAAASLSPGDALRLVFADGDADARVEGEAAPPAPKPTPVRKPAAAPPGQGNLF